MEPEGRDAATAPPSGGARARRRSMVRGRLSAAALTLFAERGYDATTVDDIVAAGGTSRSTFFRCFGTKDDVVLYRLDDVGADWVTHYRALLAEGDPCEALAGALVLAVREAAKDPKLFELMLLAVTDQALRGKLQTKIEDWRTKLYVVTAESTGSDPADLRPAALTYLMVGAGSAAFAAWLQSGGKGDIVALIEEAVGYARTGCAGIRFAATASGAPAAGT